MNMAAFAVITAREREAGVDDDITSLYGLGADRPWLAWPMTIAMLSLAGFPATAGFFGKLYLIQAAVDNDYAWLGVVIVLGSAISLVYYLRVVAAVWMHSPAEAPAPGARVPGARPVMAGGSHAADDLPAPRPSDDVTTRSIEVSSDGESAARGPHRRQLEVVFLAALCAVAVVAFGIYPDPLLDVARDAGDAISSLV
jgi:NADH-quinone oxidoreductase subunit N